MTHEDLQRQIVDLAHLLGWEVLHVRKSIGRGQRWTTSTSIVGWPDLLCFKPRCGFVAIELKVGKDKPTVAQQACLAALDAAGAETIVAYPDDFDRVHELLRRKPSEAAA